MKQNLLKSVLLVLSFCLICPAFAAGDDTCCDGGMVCNACDNKNIATPKNAGLTRGQPEETVQAKSAEKPCTQGKPAQVKKKSKKETLVKRCVNSCD